MESHYEYGTRARLAAYPQAAQPTTASASTLNACGRAVALLALARRGGGRRRPRGVLPRLALGAARQHGGATERAVIARAVAAIASAAGAPPVGWHTRSAPSVNTRRLLVEHGGFLYDSNAYNDDVPYMATVGGRDIVMLPYAFDTNDMRFQPGGGFVRGDDFARYCIDAFDALYREGESAPRMLSVGLHLRIIGRPGTDRRARAPARSHEACSPASGSRAAMPSRPRGGQGSASIRGNRGPRSVLSRNDMRLLIANPNTTEAVTQKLLASAERVAAPGTELIAVTAPRGVPYIATRADAVVGGAVALEMLAEHHDKVDAAVIAAFGDPGLGGARELFDIPVVGMAEAAMLSACMLGRSFAIVTFSGGLVPWYNECLDWNGLRGRCAGIFALQRRLQVDCRRAVGEGGGAR